MKYSRHIYAFQILILLCFFTAQALKINSSVGWSMNVERKRNIRDLEAELQICLNDDSLSGRKSGKLGDTGSKIEALMKSLEKSYEGKMSKNNEDKPSIDGVWKLLYTSSPGTNSPIQRTFTSVDTFGIYQVVNLARPDKSFLRSKDKNVPLPDVSNIVCFGTSARLRVTALASTYNKPFITPRKGDGKIFGLNIFGVSSDNCDQDIFIDKKSQRIDFAFQDARFEFANYPLYLPYPVPFSLLGDEAKGFIDNTFISDSSDFRIARGNKGTKFLLQRADPETDKLAAFAVAKLGRDNNAISKPLAPSSSATGAAVSLRGSDKLLNLSKSTLFDSFLNQFSTTKRSKIRSKIRKRVAIILPAQLSTDSDYRELIETISTESKVKSISKSFSGKAYACSLKKIDWPLGLLPSFFSKKYIEGKLVPSESLRFYFKAIDNTVEQALMTNAESVDNLEFTLIGHSIGTSHHLSIYIRLIYLLQYNII